MTPTPASLTNQQRQRLLMLSRILGTLGIIFVFGILFSLGSCGGGGYDSKPPMGLRLENLTANSLDGQPVSLAAYSGKPVILDVWATWCGPCRQQREVLHRLKEKWGDSVTIIAVSGDDSPGLVSKYLADNPAKDAELMLTPELRKAIGGVRGFPTFVLFDAEGKATRVLLGGRDEAFWMKAIDDLS